MSRSRTLGLGGVALAASFVVACGAQTGTADPAPIALAELVRLPVRYDYVEYTQTDDGPIEREDVHETFSKGARPDGIPAPEGEIVESLTHRDDPNAVDSRGLFVVGSTGYGHFATLRPDGWTTYATKVELPPTVRPGDTWEGTHEEGPRRSTRTCEATSTPFCADGVATTCTTRWSNKAIWLRQHWCKGAGWVGFDALVLGESLTMRSWSGVVNRDGQPLPIAPMSRRPIPDPGAIDFTSARAPSRDGRPR